MKKYGIKVEYETGDIVYFGKGLNDFISYNMTKAPREIIQGKRYNVAYLESTLIEKYGYATEKNAERALELMLAKYPQAFTRAKLTLVVLNTNLREQLNFDNAIKAIK